MRDWLVTNPRLSGLTNILQLTVTQPIFSFRIPKIK